jgi:hypothetical protein
MEMLTWCASCAQVHRGLLPRNKCAKCVRAAEAFTYAIALWKLNREPDWIPDVDFLDWRDET